MEKIFDNYKGVMLFYLVIAILALLWSMRVSQLNKTGINYEIKGNYYAMSK